MATFQVCDTNADDGLNLEEIKQDECKEVLQKLFGLSTDVLQDTFFHLDENMDKVISKEEGHAASQSLDRFGPICQSNTTFGTKVLVTAGNTLTTEIIDLKDSSFACTKVGKLPKDFKFAQQYGTVHLLWEFANGGWVGNTPMFCGGTVDFGKIFHKSCYILQENGAWKEDKKAKLIRGKQSYISGSVVIKDQLFIPEIVKKNGRNFLNFEMVAPNKRSETLQQLNNWGRFVNAEASCVVNWDANTIMLIGVNLERKGTFFINMGNKTVTPGPDLIERRTFHACHEMTVQSESFIIVTGGTFWKDKRQTEILSKSSFEKGWQRGKNVNVN